MTSDINKYNIKTMYSEVKPLSESLSVGWIKMKSQPNQFDISMPYPAPILANVLVPGTHLSVGQVTIEMLGTNVITYDWQINLVHHLFVTGIWKQGESLNT